MWWLAIPALVVVGGWLYGAKLVATKSPPLPHDTFTAPGKVQVGDIVTVAVVSVDDVDSETSLAPDPAASAALMMQIKPSDIETMKILDKASNSGGTAKFQVTATGLVNKDGVPVTIGVLAVPAVSVRIPALFLTASVRQIERNGKVVS